MLLFGEKVIRKKVDLLNLADEPSNVYIASAKGDLLQTQLFPDEESARARVGA